MRPLKGNAQIVRKWLKGQEFRYAIDMKKIESAETSADIVPIDIRPLIYEIRGRQVMLDRDLIERFPDELMFQLANLPIAVRKANEH